MLLITRRLAGRLRVVLRKALNLSTRGLMPPVELLGSADGLRLCSRTPDAAAEFYLAGEQPAEHVTVPFQMLADVEGRRDDPVEIRLHEGRVLASWRDGSVPQVVQHDAPESPSEDWPPMPQRLAENTPGLLKALDDACQTTDPDSTRYALGCVQLRGKAGKIVATDGRQLLIQSGFTFPWDNDVLVPGTKVFGSPHLPQEEPVLVGRTDDWFTLSVGAWTFWWRIDKEGRFPKVEDHVQRPEQAIASFQLSETDRRFLVENLPRLPGDDVMNFPVTLDLNGAVAVRAQGEGQTAVTELLLAGSTATGEPVRINTNRQYLARAVRLGFDRVHVFSPKTPVLACDEHRSYVWALLEPESAIGPAEDAVRIASSAPQSPVSTAKPIKKRSTPAVSPSIPNTTSRARTDGKAATKDRPRKASGCKADPSDLAALVEQAEKFRSAARDLAVQAGALVKALKHYRRQSRSVVRTIESLRQLRGLGV